MKTSHFGIRTACLVALLVLCGPTPLHAQQPAGAQNPTPAQSPAQPTQNEDAIVVPRADTKPVQEARVPRELSPWSMFLSADIVVKAVMISLAFASLVSWTIFFAKLIELSFARRRLAAALDRINQTRSLTEAEKTLASTKSVLG